MLYSNAARVIWAYYSHMGPCTMKPRVFNWVSYPKRFTAQCLQLDKIRFNTLTFQYETCTCSCCAWLRQRLPPRVSCVFRERVSDSLVVEHHVRQPDVFGGQPDLQHPVKLLRDPSQPIVLPLLRANKNKALHHLCANRAATRVEEWGEAPSVSR